MVPNVVRRPVGRSVGRWIGRRGVLAVVSVASVVGCRTDAPTASGSPVALQRVSGDGQTARPDAPLDRPLVARLVDADGRPVRRVEVRWTVTAGTVSPEISATDANGDAKTVWRLGPTEGVQRAVASADGIDPVEFVAYVDPNALPDRIPLRVIPLATYDGSGQAVHPDVATPPFTGLDARARLVITPYPWGNASFENPSLFVGDERNGWGEPAGLTNPVVRPESGYLSDPDIIWLDDVREFWLYYRHVGSENAIMLTRSGDGSRWGASRPVVTAPNHRAVSPTVVRRSATEWLMWTVNAGPAGCGASSTTVELRRSTDGLSWAAPVAVSLSQAGVFPWHLDVQWIGALREYWAMFNGKVAGSCTTDALFLATSADGVTWRTYPSPVLQRGAIPELADVVYRASFAYDAERDLVSIFHSGARYAPRGYEWRAAYERRHRDDLFDAVSRAGAAMIGPATAPPLTNATAP
jgi:hypothetical protein